MLTVERILRIGRVWVVGLALVSCGGGNDKTPEDTGTPPPMTDTTPPAQINALVATVGDNVVNLSWANPTDSDFAGVTIRRATDDFPAAPDGGDEVYRGTLSLYADTGLWVRDYYYSIFSFDNAVPPNYSKPVNVKAMPFDHVAPHIKLRTPAPDSNNGSATAPIAVVFNEPMASATIDDQHMTFYRVYAPGNYSKLSGAVSYDPDTYTARYAPAQRLEYEQRYRVVMSATITDAQGNALAQEEAWEFTVEPDTYGPVVLQTTPENGTTGVAVTTTLRIRFDEALDTASVNAQTVVISGIDNVTSIFGSGNNIFVDTATGQLPYNRNITVQLTTGIKDAKGNPFATLVNIAFSTELDTVAPTIVKKNLFDNQSLVSITPAFTFTFSEPMDVATITPANIAIAGIVGTVDYDLRTFAVTYTPTTPLANHTNYTLTIASGVRDAQGHGLSQAQSYRFTTVYAPVKVSENTSAITEYHKLVIADNGHRLAVWRVNHGAAYKVMAKYFSGSSWGSEVVLDSGAPGASGFIPKVVTNGTDFLVAWLKSGSGGGVSQLNTRLVSSGDWGQTRVSSSAPNESYELASDGRGYMIVGTYTTSIDSSVPRQFKYTQYQNGAWTEGLVFSGSFTTGLRFKITSNRQTSDNYAVITQYNYSTQTTTFSVVSAYRWSPTGWQYNLLTNSSAYAADGGLINVVSDGANYGFFWKHFATGSTRYKAKFYRPASTAWSAEFSLNYVGDYEGEWALYDGTAFRLVWTSRQTTPTNAYFLYTNTVTLEGVLSASTTIRTSASQISMTRVVSGGQGYAAYWREGATAWASVNGGTAEQLASDVTGGGYGDAPFEIVANADHYALYWTNSVKNFAYARFYDPAAGVWSNSVAVPADIVAASSNVTAVPITPGTHFALIYTQSGAARLRYAVNGADYTFTYGTVYTLTSGQVGDVDAKPISAVLGNNAMLVWQQYHEDKTALFARRISGTAPSGAAFMLSPDSRRYAFSIAGIGQLFVIAWIENKSVMTRAFNVSTGAWAGTAQTIFTPSINDTYDPMLASNGNDILLVWSYNGIYTSTGTVVAGDISWGAPTQIRSDFGLTSILGVAGNGATYAVAYDTPTSSDTVDVMVLDGGVWRNHYFGAGPTFALVGANNTFLVAYGSYTQVRTSFWEGGTLWSTGLTLNATAPQLAYNAGEFLLLTGSSAIDYRFYRDQTWSEPVRQFFILKSEIAAFNGHYYGLSTRVEGSVQHLRAAGFNAADYGESGGTIEPSTNDILPGYLHLNRHGSALFATYNERTSTSQVLMMVVGQ